MRNGRHINGFKYRNRRTDCNGNNGNSGRTGKNNSIFGTIISAFAGLIINDISSPDSKIKRVVGNIFNPKKIEKKEETAKIIKAEYEVIEDNKKIKEIEK